MPAYHAKSMKLLSDYILFAYKTHTNIRQLFIFDYEIFEVLAEDDIYIFSSLYFSKWNLFMQLFPNQIIPYGPIYRRCLSLFHFSIYSLCDNAGFSTKRIEYIERNLLEKSLKRPFCCTVFILQVFFTYLCYITFWALDYHFIENLKLMLNENQIIK